MLKGRNYKTRSTRWIRFLFPFLALGASAMGQSAYPASTSHQQTWLSFNSITRFSDHWGLMADFHMRRDDFVSKDYFYFVRLGAVTWISGKYPIAYGVAHLWQAPREGNVTWSHENRIFEQWSASQRAGRFSILQRVRLEQRWRDLVVNDQKTGDKQFSVRLRYLASFDLGIFSNPRLPSLVLSDEILVQAGDVINTFDQNRFFLGLKVPISRSLTSDVGYMNILQQRAPNSYDTSHVFRLFLYYTLDFRKDKGVKEHFENTE